MSCPSSRLGTLLPSPALDTPLRPQRRPLPSPSSSLTGHSAAQFNGLSLGSLLPQFPSSAALFSFFPCCLPPPPHISSLPVTGSVVAVPPPSLAVPPPSLAAGRKGFSISRCVWPSLCGPEPPVSPTLLAGISSSHLAAVLLQPKPPEAAARQPAGASPAAADDCMAEPPLLPPAQFNILPPPPAKPPNVVAATSHANPTPIFAMQSQPTPPVPLTPHITPLAAMSHPNSTCQPPIFPLIAENDPFSMHRNSQIIIPSELFLVHVPIHQGIPNGKIPRKGVHHASGAYAISVTKASAHKKA